MQESGGPGRDIRSAGGAGPDPRLPQVPPGAVSLRGDVPGRYVHYSHQLKALLQYRTNRFHLFHGKFSQHICTSEPGGEQGQDPRR